MRDTLRQTRKRLPQLAALIALLLLLTASETEFRTDLLTPDKSLDAAAEKSDAHTEQTPSANAKTTTEKPDAHPQRAPAANAQSTASGNNPLMPSLKKASQTLLLKLRPGARIDPNGALAAYQAKPEVETRRLHNLNILLLTFPKTWDAATVTETLSQDPAVQYTAEDAVMKAQASHYQPPDDLTFEQTHNPRSPPLSQFEHLIHANAIGAWPYTTGSRDVVVAVMDTGIDFIHPDLENNLWVNSAELNGNPGMDDDHPEGPRPCERFDYCDDIHGWNAVYGNSDIWDNAPIGHGTVVAGVIGAEGNNGKGLVGIAWQVQLMAVKVLNSNEVGYFSGFFAGLNYILEMKRRNVNVKVVNASLSFDALTARGVELLQDSLSRLGEEDILFVSAAGNDGNKVEDGDHLPGSLASVLDNVLNVGGVLVDREPTNTPRTVGGVPVDSEPISITRAGRSSYSKDHVSLGASYHAYAILSGLGIDRFSQQLNGFYLNPDKWAAEPAGSWTATPSGAGQGTFSLNQTETTSLLTWQESDNIGDDPITAFVALVRYSLPNSVPGSISCGTTSNCMVLSFKTDDHADWQPQIFWFDNSIANERTPPYENLVFRLPDEFKESGFRFRFESIPVTDGSLGTASFEVKAAQVYSVRPDLYSDNPRAINGQTGTSVAAPQVAGAAALIWAQRPELSYREVSAAILNTVTTLTSSSNCSGGQCFKHNGMLNVSKALAFVTTPGIVINTEQSDEFSPGDDSSEVFSVRLTREPGVFGGPHQVQVSVATGSSSGIPETLTFDAENWFVPQMIAVTPTTDSSVPLTLEVTQSGSDYSGVAASVPFGIPQLLAPKNISLTEGGKRRVALSLTKQPSTNITLTPIAEPDGYLVFTPPEITLTRSNWEGQMLTVSAPIDLLSDADELVVMSFRASPSNSIDDPGTLTVTIADNGQRPGISVTQRGGRLRENTTLTVASGERLTLDIMLEGQPTTNVELRLATETSLIVIPTTLRFTPADWSSVRHVTIVDTSLQGFSEPDGWIVPIPKAVADSIPTEPSVIPDALVLSVNAAASDVLYGNVPPQRIDVIRHPPPMLRLPQSTLTLTENTRTTLNAQLSYSPHELGLSTITASILTPDGVSADPLLTDFTPDMPTSDYPDETLHYNHDHPIVLSTTWDGQIQDRTDSIIVQIVVGKTIYATSTPVKIINTDLPVIGPPDDDTVIVVREGDDLSFDLAVPARPATNQMTVLTPTAGVLTPVMDSGGTQSTLPFTVAPAPAGLLTFSPSTLAFTRDDWTTRRLTISTLEDPVSSDPLLIVLVFRPQGAGIVAPADVYLRITRHPRLVGFADATLPEGTRMDFNLRLSKPPSSIVSLVPTAAQRLTFTPTTLVFTPDDWSDPQTLSVSASVDLLSDADVSIAMSFNEEPPGVLKEIVPATIAVADNGQMPDIRMEQAQGRLRNSNRFLYLIAGESLPLAVSLQGQPNADVELNLAAAVQELAVEPERLVFGPDDWNRAQTVVVTADDDVPALLAQRSLLLPNALSLAVNAGASDRQYAGLSRSITVFLYQQPQLLLTPASPQLAENTSITLNAQLNHSPEEFDVPQVSVDIAAMPTAVSVNPASLVFTPDVAGGCPDMMLCYNIDHPIVLTANRDGLPADYIGTVAFTVTGGVFAMASTTLHIPVANAELSVLGLDDATVSAGESTVLTLSLSAQPATDQTIILTPVSSLPEELQPSPSSLVFTRMDWRDRRLTLSAPDGRGEFNTVAVLSLEVQGEGVIPPLPARITIDRDSPVIRMRIKVLLEGALQ